MWKFAVSADTVPNLKSWAEQLAESPFPALRLLAAWGSGKRMHFPRRAGINARALPRRGPGSFVFPVYAPGTIPEIKDLLEKLTTLSAFQEGGNHAGRRRVRRQRHRIFPGLAR